MKRLSLLVVGLAVCAMAGCGGSGGSSSSSASNTPNSSSMSPPGAMAPPGGMPMPGAPGASPMGASPMGASMTPPMPGTNPMASANPMGGANPMASPMGGTATLPGGDSSQGPVPGGTTIPMPMGGSSQGPPLGGTTTLPMPMGGTSLGPMPMGGSSVGPTPGGTTTVPMPMGGTSLGPTPMPMGGTTTIPMPMGGTSLGPVPGGTTTVPMPMGGTSIGPTPGGGTPGINFPGNPNAPNAGATGPRSLSERAEDAFRKGNDREGFQLTYAAAIANEEAAAKLPDQFRWIASLKKPAMGVRFGLGVIYNSPKGYTGHPSPVGYSAPEPVTNNNGPSVGPTPGGSGPGGANSGQKPKKSRVFGQRNREQKNSYGQGGSTPTSPSGQPSNDKPPPSHPPGDPAEFLSYYTGEVGDKVVEILGKRITDGAYGPVLQHAAEVFVSGPVAPTNNNFPGGINVPGSAGPVPGGVGPMPGSIGPVPGGASFPGAPGGNAAPKREKFEVSAIGPGIVMLGEGSESELLKTAEEQEVDFVILFEVSVRKSNKDATNNCKFHMVALDKAKLAAAASAEGQKPGEVFTSGTINNKRVESAREDDDTDPLETEIAAFEKALDAEVVLTPLSEKVTTEEVALKRATFLASKEDNQLASLAEIRHYQVAKLIKAKDAAQLFEKILGKANADMLLKAKTEADRAAALTTAKLLAKS